MKTNDIENIIRKKIRVGIVQDIVLILISLVGGLVVLFLTYWLIYGIIWISLGYLLPVEDYVGYMSTGILILLFIGNLRTSREYLTEYSFSTGTASDKIVSCYIPGVGMGSTINPLAPDSARSYIKIITDLLYIGPRIITWGTRKFNRIFHLIRLDIPGCAGVVSVLNTADGRVSFIEIAERLGDLNLNKIFNDLRYVDIVIFLSNDPPGLTLKSKFLAEIKLFNHQNKGFSE